MKTVTISVIAILILAAICAAQTSVNPRSAGADLLGALTGDMDRFRRGMEALEGILSKTPQDPEAKVMHGTGLMVLSGEAFQKGDLANGGKLWQSGLEEMAWAVEAAPENIFVRARRGVFLISASRSTPPAMGKPLVALAVSDFEKVLQIREREQTLAQRSTHQRGELLTSLADGWDRMGDREKARGYFERIVKDLKGTVYEQRARAWLDEKSEAKAPDFFACNGCHVEN